MRVFNHKNFPVMVIPFIMPFVMICIGGISSIVQGYAADPLPRYFRIYIDGKGNASSLPMPGYQVRLLPSVNLIIEKPGCYVACYSTNPDKGVYAIQKDIYVVGQIRVRGQYEGKNCVPEDYEGMDIGPETHFKELCSKTFNCIGDSCWANGNTGEWFGLK